MHKKFLDVCFEVHRTQYRDKKRTKYKGFWNNLGYTGNPWRISQLEKLEIKTEDKVNWKAIDETIKRTKPGMPLPYNCMRLPYDLMVYECIL